MFRYIQSATFIMQDRLLGDDLVGGMKGYNAAYADRAETRLHELFMEAGLEARIHSFDKAYRDSWSHFVSVSFETAETGERVETCLYLLPELCNGLVELVTWTSAVIEEGGTE